MSNTMNIQTRVLIATVISLVVFVAYDYFLLPKPTQPNSHNPSQQKQIAPSTKDSTKQVADRSTKQHAAPSQASNRSQMVTNDTSSPHAEKIPLSQTTIATIETTNAKILFDGLGRIRQVYLKDKQYRDEEGKALKLYNNPAHAKPLEIRFSDPLRNSAAFTHPYQASASYLKVTDQPQTLRLYQTFGKTTVEKIITIYPDHHYDISLHIQGGGAWYISTGARPDIRVDTFTVHGAMIEEADGTLTFIEDGDAKGNEAFRNARIAVAFDRYYASALYDFDKGFDVIVDKTAENDPLLFIKSEGQNTTLHGYIGPKEYNILHAIHPELSKIIEFGWFTFIAMPMFKILLWLHQFIPNWGWTIVVLTILIRFLLYPLTYKGMVSMHRLKQLQPKIKEIQQKYKGDPAKMNLHMMELYKKHKANPLGGCLPMLLQIPVFFAIYRVLLNAIELKGAPWIGWINDLSVMDPYYVLPLIMGATMWLQQRVTPSNFTDPMQEKIFKWLPVVFTFFFITFPAGLVLYWTTNNLFSIAQQLMINRLLEKESKDAA